MIGVTPGIHWSVFEPTDTLASRIASEYQSAASNLQLASLVYLGLILLVISLLMNLIAVMIVNRIAVRSAGG